MIPLSRKTGFLSFIIHEDPEPQHVTEADALRDSQASQKGVAKMLNNKFTFATVLILLVASAMAAGCTQQQQEVKASIDDDSSEI